MIVDIVPGDRVARTASRHPKDIGKVAIARDVSADERRDCRSSRCRRMAAPAPSPKRTQVLRSVQSVMVRQFFRADHENGVVGVAGDELLRDFDREKKSRAGRRDVEASGLRSRRSSSE